MKWEWEGRRTDGEGEQIKRSLCQLTEADRPESAASSDANERWDPVWLTEAVSSLKTRCWCLWCRVVVITKGGNVLGAARMM